MRDTAENWMKLALKLAEKGRSTTSPNPMVGACIVRGNRIVGQGHHKHYGGDHAEIQALRAAEGRTQGATLYVTLEPCASWGKTPPCVAAIVRSGIRQVIVGALDPSRVNHGKGIRALRQAGIQVRTNLLAEDVKKQNEAFFKYVEDRLPFVTLKMAQSLDGKIATSEGRSRWISSPTSRRFVHRLRAEQDALLIGKNTLLLDNPRLSPYRTVKHFLPGKPWRVVLDAKMEASPKARIFQGNQLTFLAVSEKNLSRFEKSKGLASCILLPLREQEGQLDVKELLKKLAGLGIAKLLVEGGGELAWSLLRDGLVDKAYWIIAPKIVGGRLAKTSVEGEGIRILSQAIDCRQVKASRLGEDWLWECRF
jgi:diaminohydroxyphosphoribosylaminopyrimidine deaminase/5-amino-6-(5-phosphoribosylamino)uracil reductase